MTRSLLNWIRASKRRYLEFLLNVGFVDGGERIYIYVHIFCLHICSLTYMDLYMYICAHTHIDQNRSAGTTSTLRPEQSKERGERERNREREREFGPREMP